MAGDPARFARCVLLCVIRGATCGRRWDQSSARKPLARTPARAGVRRRFAPHQLRHAHAVEMAHEGVPLVVIQRQLGHANLGVTSIYLQGIDSSEIIETVHARPAPVISATAGLHTMPSSIAGWPAASSPPRFPRVAGLSDAESRDVLSRLAGRPIGPVTAGRRLPCIHQIALLRVGALDDSWADDRTRPADGELRDGRRLRCRDLRCVNACATGSANR